MRFEFLTLAEAANFTPAGTLNLLGAGIRVLRPTELPSDLPAVAVTLVEASVDEAGDYPVSIRLIEPDGMSETLLDATATVNAEVADPTVPTGLMITAPVTKLCRVAGHHLLIARVGDMEAVYLFSVLAPPRARKPRRPKAK